MESRARFLGHSIHQSIAIFGRYPSAVVAAYWMALVTAWLGGPPTASVRR